MYGVPVKTLLDAGVHFGHRASRWNPRMEPYIFGKRNLIHIIDLKETLRGLIKACSFLQGLAAEGHDVLFVGTKRQAQNVVTEEATRVGMPFVAERWLGGTLTNFETVRSRLRRLEELESLETDGSYASMSKKEISRTVRERQKIFRNLHGIRGMNRLPGAMIIVDPRKEKTAVREARKMGIPSIAILDTDCDPTEVDIPVPGNDDALRSVQVLLSKMTSAIAAGRQAHSQYVAAEEKRRQDDESKREAQKKQRVEDQKKKAAQQVELEKVLKKAREDRARRLADEARDDSTPAEPAADAAPAAPEATETPAPAPAPEQEPVTGETKPGPAGPEPVEG